MDLQKFESKKKIITALNNTIYGAIGEQKVETVLKKLSDDYILINDFCYSFATPIKYNGDFIKSIQIDHLLISQAGIFIIETKNWSNRSFDNLELRSPVQQILRTNYALFKLLDDSVQKHNWNFSRQHWGNRKIPIKNIIVFINNAPKEQYQFIKILRLGELISYIQYFNSNFTINETESIANYLLNLSQHNEVISKLSM
ncbi:nuclease-related domain-containing protein [Flavobacterium procerum]